MDITKFLQKIPYIYHLTDKNNFPIIIKNKTIYSTNTLIDNSAIIDKESAKSTRRDTHLKIKVNGEEISIRDQKPLNKALEKCLSGNWIPGQYIYHLNNRVFFWPNIKRLEVHYGRYKDEKPIIIRVNTNEVFKLNKSKIEITHLNSGATRPLASLGGKAPMRGIETFKKIENFDDNTFKIAEVTILEYCQLPGFIDIANSPNPKGWETIQL